MKLSLEYLIRKPKSSIKNPPVLIMLHGYGSNEQDLFSFANELPDDLLIISVRAPLNMAYGGYAWYTIHFDNTDGKFSDTDEALKSKAVISTFIDEVLVNFEVNPKKVFLLGFSQGTILSFSVALSYPEKVQYVIGLSGYINSELLPKDLNAANFKNLEIYCSHGSVDQVIPVEWARKTKPFLDNLGINNIYEEYQVGHGVAPQNFYSLKQWIEKRI